mgnify:CR=1 FL=1
MYSEAEIRMFKALGFNYLLFCQYAPPLLYEIVMKCCFIANMEGDDVDALRRGCKALVDGNPYRLTKEFDSLLEF